MNKKNSPTLIYHVDDFKKFLILGGGNELYVSNQMDPKIVINFLEIMSDEIKVIIFDPLEYQGGNTIDLKRNGRCVFKLNKKYKIWKQKYYYYSKNRVKYKTTMWEEHIKKNCNYTKDIQSFRFMQSQIFYTSYENTAELINEDKNLNISRQSMYNYEREQCITCLPLKEQALWDEINRLKIKASGYYHYDEEFIKINGDVYVRLSLIDAHTYIIINDLLISKDEFNKDFIKKFLSESLDGLELDTIITDGHRSYPEIIDELGAKHQLCRFHIMQILMNPLSKKIRVIKRRIESYENKIDKKEEKIKKLKKEYPYGPGRPPHSDKKACKNVDDRKNLRMEKSELTTKLNQLNNELDEIIYYKNEIKKIFDFKTLKGSMNKFNKLFDKKEELPTIIYDFLKNLSKKIDRALQFTKDKSIPKTNNLIELFYKVTFPGKIKRIYRTLEGAQNRIRMNNIRWMERNVLKKYEENI